MFFKGCDSLFPCLKQAESCLACIDADPLSLPLAAFEAGLWKDDLWNLLENFRSIYSGLSMRAEFGREVLPFPSMGDFIDVILCGRPVLPLDDANIVQLITSLEIMFGWQFVWFSRSTHIV
jgi:hypothetical protein